METWLLIVLGTLIVVFIFIFGVLTHAGYFSDLRIRTSLPVSLPRRAAYLIHRGPYKEVCTPLERITAIGRHQKIFCVFYDDPEKVPPDKLRSIVGCVLPDTPDSTVEKSLKASGCSVWTFPQCGKAVITEFPCRSFVSTIIAPGIVYPALKRYFGEFDLKCVGPILEIYGDGYTQYVAPLENNEGFFVPEIAQENESKKSQ
ncbi:Testis-expressed protein 264 [Geodia barretti]|uniref:Testis-expressed protein 264 n=1 Tax=Geodia barretti TaxID=519541 RepID=A0AA35SI93_GEOBA|nr:Testis-expressed protein 264 [Geodia barretti]